MELFEVPSLAAAAEASNGIITLVKFTTKNSHNYGHITTWNYSNRIITLVKFTTKNSHNYGHITNNGIIRNYSAAEASHRIIA